MSNDRVDLLKLVPDHVLVMEENEFIEFAKSKFNLSVRSLRTSIKEVGIAYTYLCKLYNISSRYIKNSIIYKDSLVTQRFIADNFGFNEMTIGRHRKRINDDELFIKMLEENKLIDEDILIKNRLSTSKRMNGDLPQYIKSPYCGNEILDFGFGVKCTVVEFSDLYKTGQLSKLVHKIEEHGLEKVHIHYITGAHYSDIPKNIYIVDDYPYSIKTLCEQFKCPYDTGKRLSTKLSKEDFIKYVTGRLDGTTNSNGINISINVENEVLEFNSIRELSRFLNASNTVIHREYLKDNLSEIIKEYKIEERLKFKDNTPYAEWYADSTWIYTCPVCMRKQLLTTNELINYSHDNVLCLENEIDD